jgi:drug/metabolite transporter (DMT)-like permease
MALHVLFAAGTFVFSKAAALSFADPFILTVCRGLGCAALFLAFTGWKIPLPDFSLKEWARLLVLGILLVPLNQYCFLKGLQMSVPGHSALLYALTPLGVLLLSAGISRKMPSFPKLFGVCLAFSGVIIVLRPWGVRGRGERAENRGFLADPGGVKLDCLYDPGQGDLQTKKRRGGDGLEPDPRGHRHSAPGGSRPATI